MPNRCYNTVTINGPKKDIKKIKSYIKKIPYHRKDKEWNKITDYETRFLNSFYPMPKELESWYKCDSRQEYKAKKKYKPEGWYWWRTANRWCKWDVDPYICPTSTNTQIFLSFDSPWAPPLKALNRLAKVHPKCDISIQYEEWGMWFSWEANRLDWELNYHDEFDDAYFGNGKQCTICGYEYNWENEEDRYDDKRTICYCCWDDLESKKGTRCLIKSRH